MMTNKTYINARETRNLHMAVLQKTQHHIITYQVHTQRERESLNCLNVSFCKSFVSLSMTSFWTERFFSHPGCFRYFKIGFSLYHIAVVWIRVHVMLSLCFYTYRIWYVLSLLPSFFVSHSNIFITLICECTGVNEPRKQMKKEQVIYSEVEACSS